MFRTISCLILLTTGLLAVGCFDQKEPTQGVSAIPTDRTVLPLPQPVPAESTAHVQSDEFRNVLAAMDMCCEEPSVVTGTLSGREGIAYLRDLRGRTG